MCHRCLHPLPVRSSSYISCEVRDTWRHLCNREVETLEGFRRSCQASSPGGHSSVPGRTQCFPPDQGAASGGAGQAGKVSSQVRRGWTGESQVGSLRGMISVQQQEPRLEHRGWGLEGEDSNAGRVGSWVGGSPLSPMYLHTWQAQVSPALVRCGTVSSPLKNLSFVKVCASPDTGWDTWR